MSTSRRWSILRLFDRPERKPALQPLLRAIELVRVRWRVSIERIGLLFVSVGMAGGVATALAMRIKAVRELPVFTTCIPLPCSPALPYMSLVTDTTQINLKTFC